MIKMKESRAESLEDRVLHRKHPTPPPPSPPQGLQGPLLCGSDPHAATGTKVSLIWAYTFLPALILPSPYVSPTCFSPPVITSAVP